MASTYKQISVHDDEAGNVLQLTDVSSTTTAIQSESSFDDANLEAGFDEHPRGYNTIHGPVLLSTFTTFLLIPILLFWGAFAYHLTGRLWASWIVVLHLHFCLVVSRRHFNNNCMVKNNLSLENDQEQGKQHQQRTACYSYPIIASLDVILCGIIYPIVIYLLAEVVFRDVDGTINLEWKGRVILMWTMGGLGIVVAFLRLGVGIFAWYIRRCPPSKTTYYYGGPIIISNVAQQRISNTFRFANMAILILDILCILSVLSHFGPWPQTSISFSSEGEQCDPLDTTLCALPFPSFHHMEMDTTTTTGWKVNLKGLPPLRGNIPLHPKFLNELDGFSTMAPILFYMDGLKEAHEVGAHDNVPSLQGPASIEMSTTNQSITLLINVDEHELVPHSAEIDYLDEKHPLVMIMPAIPLSHNTHYAVAVVDASDVNGNRLPQSKGLETILKDKSSSRHERYIGTVLPALQNAAKWTNFDADPESLQLLFDFVTISEGSQIGHTRAARDIALQYVDGWDWQDHVELVTEIKHDCSHSDTLVARTYHIHLDVPSFLKHRSRYSTLDHNALETGKPVSIEKAKAIIQVPCSVELAALGDGNGMEVKAIMEFGHGLFHHRGEVEDRFLSRMAHENGYILMAMDFRGMSRFDLPIVIKTLIGNPNLFQSVRDNLIQGFSEKLVLQHFSQNGMMDWLKIMIDGVKIPTVNNEQPTSVFYGISQGGILGGGYLALAGNTNLINRGVLGSPGTPFTSVLARSRDFIGYDIVMLFNFYNNRHVRLLLSLVQMGWDSVEVSGLLAPSVKEPLPPVLIQTGLGDSIVPTSASEAMARAMNGTILPSNERSIFGVPISELGGDSHVVLTEIVYEKEYESLPVDNTLADENNVHWCVRVDPVGILQIESFVNTGVVLDPCENDQCRRQSSIQC